MSSRWPIAPTLPTGCERCLKKPILIADDDAALVHVVSKRCEAFGLNVKRAYGVLNALSIVQAEAPDLVCCDVNMPDGNGLAACEILATSSHWSGIPAHCAHRGQDAGTIQALPRVGRLHYVVKGEKVWPRARAADSTVARSGACVNRRWKCVDFNGTGKSTFKR